MDGSLLLPEATELPDWMPDNVRNYLTHTINGVSIRELARQQGCHASTIMRQVRRIEARRDDPLVDNGLLRLGDALQDGCGGANLLPTDETLATEAVRLLRRLCEVGSVLAVAEGMQNGVVMRGVDGDAGLRTAVVPIEIAQAMALCDWLSCAAVGKVSRYRVSAAGRAALGQLLAATENLARSRNDGFAEAQTPFARRDGDGAAAPRQASIQSESPLIALSRRRDRDGNRFLDDSMVRAGERLREDYELSRLADGHAAAQSRLTDALEELGPGLADVALRCCCHLEGLESTEQRMGWSARSGKIVLRIALQRLSRFYEQRAKQGGDMIG